MSNINQAYFDRVRYTLYNKTQGKPVIITEPIGWNSDEKELNRHNKYHGIISSFSNSSKFVGDGKEFIQLVYDIEGIQGEIKMTREEKNPITDVWTVSYSGYLDLSTWETEDNKISIKFNSGGLEQSLKARESEQIEIDRNTTIDGNSMAESNTITVALDGRNIFLQTKYDISEGQNTATLYNQTNGQTRGTTVAVPLHLLNKSHENAQSPLTSTSRGNDSWDRTGSGELGLLFFAVSDRDRDVDIKLSISFKLNFLKFDDVNHFNFWLRLVTFQDSEKYLFKQNRMLFTGNNYNSLNGETFSVTFNETITILSGESLGLVFDQNFDGANGKSAHLEIKVSDIQSAMFFEEKSFYENSKTKSILPYELFDRLVTIGTNKENSFYSDFLGRTDLGYSIDGGGSLTGIAHGFWIRQFDKLPIPSEIPKVENLFKPLTTSFKDAFDSMDTIWNIGIGIERIGFRERVRLEDLSYFYNKNVTIRLPNQVKKVKRSVATEYYYSSLEFGSEKGGDYDEAMGLDEFNTRSNFTTTIDRLKETYSRISKYRCDSYGMEFARRKSKYLNDTEDTKYDNDKFLIDLKRGYNSIFLQRKWEDDFNKKPSGVFSPETATNLRFSPLNCLMRHSWWFSGGLKKYPTKYLRYGSSYSNSNLKTEITGKNEYSESGNIINHELSKARFFPEWIEFEHLVGFDTMKQVEGTSIILGKEVKNFYGLVEFINENNEKERGFLFNLKPNERGVWKLLKSNR